MKSQHKRGALLGALSLTIAACGGSGTESGSEGAESTATPAASSTTTEPTVTTERATTTTEPTVTTTEAPTTTEVEEVVPDLPPAGTGILTLDGVEYPFTINECTTEPSIVGTSTVIFEMRGEATAEGRTVHTRAFRLATGGVERDSFGYGYATDPSDFTSSVGVDSKFGLGLIIRPIPTDDGTFAFYTDEVPFERTEGISVVDDVDPGVGSMVAAC